MVMAIAGVASAKTYDFTNTPLLHKAYEGYDWTHKPPLVLGAGNEITHTTELAKFEESDNERACFDDDEAWDFHRFEFKIENASGIAQIYVLHEGYGTYNGHTLYIWNYTDSKWEVVDTTTIETPDQELTGTFTSDFSDYIQGGYLHLLAMSNAYETQTICTDYVKVEITTPQPLGVGGEAYPVNKLGILAPWIGLTMLLIGSITWFTLRRRRAQS